MWVLIWNERFRSEKMRLLFFVCFGFFRVMRFLVEWREERMKRCEEEGGRVKYAF